MVYEHITTAKPLPLLDGRVQPFCSLRGVVESRPGFPDLRNYPDKIQLTAENSDVLEDCCKDVLCKVDLRRLAASPEQYAELVEPLAIELQVACEALVEIVRTQDAELEDGDEAKRDLATLRRKYEQLERESAEQAAYSTGGGVEAIRRLQAELAERDRELQQANEDFGKLAKSKGALERDAVALRQGKADADEQVAVLIDKVKALERDVRTEREMRTEAEYELERRERAVRSSLPADAGLGSAKQERLQNEALKRDLADLEKAIGALRARNKELKAENLELCYEIQDVQKDSVTRKMNESMVEEEVTRLRRDAAMMQEELDQARQDVAEQLALHRVFEEKFARQTADAQNEINALEMQLVELRRTRRLGGGAGSGGPDPEVSEMEGQLEEVVRKNEELAKEKTTLLEAYEDLEEDTGRLVDEALAKQAETMADLRLQVGMKERQLEEEEAARRELEAAVHELQERLREVESDNKRYAEEEFGLPEAVEDISTLRAQLRVAQAAREELMKERNELEEKFEFHRDENRRLRAIADVPDTPGDLEDWRRQRSSKIAQLEALNAELERMLADMEEERRKHLAEVKFRAKYHGKHALEMGLTPEQLLLLEEFAKKLRDGSDVHTGMHLRLIEQLRQRNRLLEDRLAKHAAWADLPLPMRDLDAGPEGPPRAPQHYPGVLSPHNGQTAQPPQPDGSPPSPPPFRPTYAAQLQDQDYLKDATAEALRSHLKSLMVQITNLEVAAAKKEQELAHLNGLYQDAKVRLGPGSAPAADFTDMMTKQEYGQLERTCASYMQQLVEAVEELNLTRRSVEELTVDCDAYKAQMQTFVDQRNLLYRDYARVMSIMKAEKSKSDKTNRALKDEVADLSIAKRVYEDAVKTLEGGQLAAVSQKLDRATRDVVMTKIKHAQVARELERSRAQERTAAEGKDDALRELRELSATARTRLRWLQHSNEELERRITDYSRQLIASVPAAAYNALLEKYSAVVAQQRGAMEAATDASLRVLDEKCDLQQQLAAVEALYCTACQRAAFAEEQARQLAARLNPAIADVHQELSGDLQRAAVELQMCAVRAENADRELRRTERDLQHTKTQLLALQNQFSDQAKNLSVTQVELQTLRAQLSGALTQGEGRVLQEQLLEAEKRAAEATEQLLSLQNERGDAGKLAAEFALERKQLLAQVSYAREDKRAADARVRALEQKLALQQPGAIDLTDAFDKDTQIERLQARVDALREKEMLGQQELRRNEEQRADLDEQLRSQSAALRDRERLIKFNEDALLFNRRQCVRLEEQLRIALSGRVEKWRAELWALKLGHQRATNEELSRALHGMTERVLALEAEKATLAEDCERLRSEQTLATLPASEQQKHVAAVTERALELRVLCSKRGREVMLLHEKAAYQDKVNADLHRRLEVYEREEFRQQTELEQQLQEGEREVAKLRDKVRELEACVDAARAHGESLAARAAAGGGALGTAATLGRRASMALALEGDQSRAVAALTEKIDDIKALKDQLAHKEAQLKQATIDHRALEDSFEEQSALYQRLIRRMEQLTAQPPEAFDRPVDADGDESLAQLLDSMRADARAQEQEMRRQAEEFEVEKAALKRRVAELTAALDAHKDAQIAAIQAAVAGLAGRGADAKDDVAGEIKQGELAKRTAQLEALRRATAAEASALHETLRERDAEVQRLQDALSRVRERQAAAPVAALEAKLREQLAKKDRLVRALREAIKQLEGKLIEAEKRNADATIRLSSWREQEKLVGALAAAQQDRAQLSGELERARRQLAETTAQIIQRDADGQAAQEQLARESAKVSDALRDLADARRALQALQARQGGGAARESADPPPGGAGPTLEQQAAELRRQVQLLEAQNARLVAALKRDNASAAQHASVGTSTDGPPHGPAPATPSKPADAPDRGAPGGQTRPTSGPKGAAAASGPGLAALERKFAALRDKLLKKNDEFASLERVAEERNHRIVVLERELGKSRQEIERLRADAAAVAQEAALLPPLRADASAVQRLVDEAEAAHARCSALELQLRRAHAAGAGTAEDRDDLESRLLESEAARAEAEAAAARCKLRLADLFGAALLDASQREALRSGKGAAAARARENELLATVESLRRALERQQRDAAHAVSNARFMQEVNRNKALAKKIAALEKSVEEGGRVKSDLQRLEQQVVELRTANTALKTSLQDARRAATAPADAANAQAHAALQQQLVLKDAETKQVQQALRQKEALLQEALASANFRAGDSTSATPSLHEDDVALRALRGQLSETLKENEALKSELNAFDPAFWDEIEDLKFERHELAKQVSAYESTIRALSAQLGRPPVL